MKRHLAVVALLALAAPTVALAEGKIIRGRSTLKLASVMDDIFSFFATPKAKPMTVFAKGSFYIPDAPLGDQLLPNQVNISCAKDEKYCTVVTVNLVPDVLPLGLGAHVSTNVSFLPIVEWDGTVVRARDATSTCAVIDYVLYFQAEAVRLEKQGIPAKDLSGEACDVKGYTALLGYVQWTYEEKGR